MGFSGVQALTWEPARIHHEDTKITKLLPCLFIVDFASNTSRALRFKQTRYSSPRRITAGYYKSRHASCLFVSSTIYLSDSSFFVFFVFFVVNSLNQEINYLINIGIQQLQLLKPGQLFYGTFPFTGRAAVMAGFDIHQLFGLPAAKIFSALLVRMLIKTPGNIIGDTSIKRVVGAKDDVDLPIHSVRRPFQKPSQRLRSGP